MREAAWVSRSMGLAMARPMSAEALAVPMTRSSDSTAARAATSRRIWRSPRPLPQHAHLADGATRRGRRGTCHRRGRRCGARAGGVQKRRPAIADLDAQARAGRRTPGLGERGTARAAAARWPPARAPGARVLLGDLGEQERRRAAPAAHRDQPEQRREAARDRGHGDEDLHPDRQPAAHARSSRNRTKPLNKRSRTPVRTGTAISIRQRAPRSPRISGRVRSQRRA